MTFERKAPATPAPASTSSVRGAASRAAPPLLAIVVPCFNEEDVLPATATELLALLDRLTRSSRVAPGSFVCFVDDGSTDRTWPIIETLAEARTGVSGIALSRNRGHQNALLAGLFGVDADVVVSIDADLQDDPDAIEAMLQAYAGGADIVYGVRSNRDADSWLKRTSARAFYRLLSACGVETVFDHADYRLMSRLAIGHLRAFGEVNLYVRGLVPLLGLRTATVHFVRRPRAAGSSKYPPMKMLALALEAVTSLSVVPLRWVTLTGFAIFLGSLAVSAWVLWARFATHTAVPGWASVTLPIFLLGGIQMLAIGIVGEYLGKIYIETKSRPRYFIDRVVGHPGPRAPPAASGAGEVPPGPH
ncbi:MAG: glycosyltransferase family 2 protein [Burkholderiaceae bacterium]|nr:glycosyltransferase family 2 protein [Burkholderiaceae bacterium]